MRIPLLLVDNRCGVVQVARSFYVLNDCYLFSFNLQPFALTLPDEEKFVDYIPYTLATAKGVNGRTPGKYVFKSLLDHGGSHTIVQRRCFRADTHIFDDKKMNFKTAMGTFTSAQYVYLDQVSLPEFSLTRRVKKVKAYLFDAPHVECDLIFGRTFLNPTGIDVCSSKLQVTWFEDTIPFKPPDYFRNNRALRQVLEVPPVRVAQQISSHALHLTPTRSTFADVREVSADLETTHPARPAACQTALSRAEAPCPLP